VRLEGSIQPRERTRELQRHGGELCHRRRHWYTDCNLTMPIAGTVMLLLWKGHLVASKLDGQHVVNGSVDARREVRMEARGTTRARAVGRSTPASPDNVGVRATSPNTTLRVRLHTERYFIQMEALASFSTPSPEGVGRGRRYSSQLCWLRRPPPRQTILRQSACSANV